MEYEKLQRLSEGKTKRLWATNSSTHAIAEFSDDAMMYHAKKKLYFEGKGRYCNEINALLMEYLEENNIATHFVERFNENSIVVKKSGNDTYRSGCTQLFGGQYDPAFGFGISQKAKKHRFGAVLQKRQIARPRNKRVLRLRNGSVYARGNERNAVQRYAGK